MTIHLAAIDIKRLVEKYPNDQELGRKIREMYIQDKDKTYRELLSLPEKEWPEEFEPGTVYPRATDNNSKSTSVTTVETQLELPI